MSATLRVEDFRENKRLFPAKFSKPPNFINVQARQYPVTVNYSKETKVDYQESAFKKIIKIHNQLPSGGILVFLTGKKEINYMCQRLRLHFKSKSFESVLIQPLFSQLSPE